MVCADIRPAEAEHMAKKPAAPKREPVPKWLRDLTELANNTKLSPDGKPIGVVELRTYFDQHDVVVGIWREPTSPTGLNHMMIKGKLVLENIVATNVTEELVTGALILRSPEEGAAMQRVLGLPETF
jgi:hypothetical protein